MMDGGDTKSILRVQLKLAVQLFHAAMTMQFRCVCVRRVCGSVAIAADADVVVADAVIAVAAAAAAAPQRETSSSLPLCK